MSRSFGGLYFTRRNYINCIQITLKPRDHPFRGAVVAVGGSFLEQRLVFALTRRPAVSFLEQRIVIEPTRRPAVIFSLRVVCSCGRIMSGIVKVIVSFFRKGEEVAIERHRSRVPVDKETHKGVSQLKKHLTEFLGLKEQAHQYGIGGFSLKLFRLAKSSAGGKCENFAIVTDGQWQLELPNLISDESSSELNGKCGTCAAEFDVSL